VHRQAWLLDLIECSRLALIRLVTQGGLKPSCGYCGVADKPASKASGEKRKAFDQFHLAIPRLYLPIRGREGAPAAGEHGVPGGLGCLLE
jgi:hypothetical protein